MARRVVVLSTAKARALFYLLGLSPGKRDV